MALEGFVPTLQSECSEPALLPSDTDSEHTETHSQHGIDHVGLRDDAKAYAPTFADDLSDDGSARVSITSSAITDQVPSLTRGSSIASFESSTLQTEAVSVLQNGYVLESDDGILTVPQSPNEPDHDLLCPFQILDCEQTFSSIREYKVHVFSHFRGHPLPTSAACFLCDTKFEQTADDDGALAWNNMLSHMAHAHFRLGQEEGTIRADFRLMRWMHDRKIISDHHFKRSQVCPARTMLPTAITRRLSQSMSGSVFAPAVPSPPSTNSHTSVASTMSLSTRRLSAYGNQVYVTRAGARAERRRRDSTRPMLQPQSVVV